MPRFLDEGQEPLQRCYKKGDIFKLLPFQGDRRADMVTQGVALGQELLPFQGVLLKSGRDLAERGPLVQGELIKAKESLFARHQAKNTSARRPAGFEIRR